MSTFHSPFDQINRALERTQFALLFSDQEKEILSLFYDEKLKARRTVVPKFFFYGHACDGKSSNSWLGLMYEVDRAIRNLERAGLIQKAEIDNFGLSGHVSQSYESYKLTADGLEVLQVKHPPIALRVRAWIAVLPPWLVLVGSIAGAVAAIWKIVELVLSFAA